MLESSKVQVARCRNVCNHMCVMVAPVPPSDLQGGDAQLNAAILRDVMGGQRGPVADALNLNAGVALAACQVQWVMGLGAEELGLRDSRFEGGFHDLYPISHLRRRRQLVDVTLQG